jgi:tetratricopeptide (TPR) repeat protein
MGNPEKDRKKAEIAVAKAEKLFENENFKKASDEFQKAGESFFELGEWKIAEQCFLYGSKAFLKNEKYANASALQRLAANCCLLVFDIAKARDYYDVSAKAILKSDVKNRDDMAAICVAFAFLCHFILGQQDESLNYIKRFKNEIDTDVFANNLLIKLSKNLTNAIINEKESYLEEILAEYPKYKFRAAEAELINAGILVGMCSVYLKYGLNLQSEEFLRDEMVELPTKLDYSKVKNIETNPVLAHKFDSIAIIDFGFSIGDNLSIKDKPELPLMVDLKNPGIKIIPIKCRTNFPGEGFIGPFMITLEIDGKFRTFLKSEAKKIKVVSPKAVLGLNFKPIKTPVINQTFPLEVEMFNQSEGDAVEIEVQFEFPEDLQMMRGTFVKNVYSLGSNERIKWEIQVKALDVGEIPIKTIVKFKDGNGNEKGPFTADIPININL